MQLRTAFSITLASVTAALIALACEPKEPEICAPKLADGGETPDGNPECSACVADRCGDAGDSCAGECEAYAECTCACDESDVPCFDACAQDKSAACTSCQEASSNAVLACVTDECQVCGLGGGALPGGENGESGSDNGSESGNDSGSSSGAACDELHAQCCPQLEGFDLELCEDAVDEGSCQLWLEVFRGEGSC